MEFDQLPAPKSPSEPIETVAPTPKPKPKPKKKIVDGRLEAKRVGDLVRDPLHGKLRVLKAKLDVGTSDGVLETNVEHAGTRGYIDGSQDSSGFTVVSATKANCLVVFDAGVAETDAKPDAKYWLIIEDPKP